MDIVYSINARLGGGGIGNTSYYAVLGSERAGRLKRVICSSFVQRDIPAQRIRSLGTLGRILKRGAVMDKTGSLNDWVDALFDQWSSRILERCDLLHCWSDLGQTLCRGKEKHMRTVLECMIHPATLRASLRQAGGRWQISSADIPSGARFNRYLQEIQTTDFIVVPSEFNYRTQVENGVLKEKIYIVPYGVDTRRFEPGEAQSSAHPFRVLFVGTFSLRKGAPDILEAWMQLGWCDAELWIAGNIAPEIASILPRWKNLPGLKFIGFYPNPVELYRQANVFLLPSLGEGSALVTYEAMACGLPVIVTENAGSLARSEIDGYLVEPGNAQSIADALERIRSNPRRAIDMGRSARQRIEPYTWSAYGERLVHLYDQLI